MSKKICIECKKEKLLNCFQLRTDTGKYRNQCKECRNNYVSKYKRDINSGKRNKFEIIIQNNKKQCNTCKVYKSLSEFPPRDTEHGFRHKCLKCKGKHHNKYIKDRSLNDNAFRLRRLQSGRISGALRKIGLNKNFKSVIKYIKCDGDFLIKWLEFQFTDDISWDNYPEVWTVDHVLPLARFDLNKLSEQDISFNWKNLSPLKDNFEKGDNIRLFQYMNHIITLHRFIQFYKLNTIEYQWINESLSWLRKTLRYGKNLTDEHNKLLCEMDNPQPST